VSEGLIIRPYHLLMEVKFSKEPADIDWSQDTAHEQMQIIGGGIFLWEPGMSTRNSEEDLLIRGNHEIPHYPLQEPPYYITKDVAVERLNYLRKRYKRPPRYVLSEMGYLEDMVKKWGGLARFLGVKKGIEPLPIQHPEGKEEWDGE